MRRATPLAPRLRARLRLPALLAALTLLLYAVARWTPRSSPSCRNLPSTRPALPSSG